MEELLQEFLTETNDSLEQVGAHIVRFESDPSDLASIGSIFRLVHTIKGTCGFLDLPRLERLSHAAETLIGAVRDRAHASRLEVGLILQALDRIRAIINTIEKTGSEPEGVDEDIIAALGAAADGPLPGHIPTAGQSDNGVNPALSAAAPQPRENQSPAKESTTIRVAVSTLERIMRLVSELVLTRNQLLEIARSGERDGFAAPLQRLSGITTDLQDGIMHARMQPVERLFSALPRMVRELSSALNKKVELVIDGADTELDRQLIELIRDPLTHLVRNCLDHGIETPHERIAAGKPEAGHLRVSANHESGHVIIQIEDDGRGIDIGRVKEKILAMGLATPQALAVMSEEEICRFIFAPGFSTSHTVTNISGRGIGMDVVRENIESISGSIALSTIAGRGTSFILKIPLTLAIAPALIFSSGGHRFALAQHTVVEAISLKSTSGVAINYSQDAPVLELRGKNLPIASLNRLFQLGQFQPLENGYAILVKSGSAVFAIAVDDVEDVQEIVLQPLCSNLANLAVYSGNTILGDGTVILILNPAGLAQELGLDDTPQYQVETMQSDITPPASATKMIFFRAGDGAAKAIPLSLLSRIETISSSQIKEVDGRLVAVRDDKLMPLIVIGNISQDGKYDPCIFDVNGKPLRASWPVMIVGVDGEPLGLLVDEISDIMEVRLDINISGVSSHILGSANINGNAIEVIDAAYLMKTGRPDAFERGHARRFRLLLVDDKIFFRDLLAPLMSASGYEVHAVESAERAFAFLAKGVRVDAIVTDIDMPEMDGYTFARKLKENAQTASIPVIALDAYAGESVIAASKNAGMSAVAGKFDRKALLEALHHALDGAAFRAEALEKRSA